MESFTERVTYVTFRFDVVGNLLGGIISCVQTNVRVMIRHKNGGNFASSVKT